MCALLLIEECALTHSAGEAISAEGRVFSPKALQDRLLQIYIKIISIPVETWNRSPACGFLCLSPATERNCIHLYFR